ncbi:serine/threonine-protein kinase fray2 [Punica granatum]|uniref:Uncharacterized protein n=2 Tax=Punica granatum TaxID=22663 RepID=A0A2I0LBI8_PUNGR|nr:serine/threonine-protein kinase fray2 [Punica granatum]PKI78049.1 hypothetical protein CRG98_001669 [Punica granatum]
MDEEKAAAYYDELTRKGGGAARFKQGLGFSSSAAGDDSAPPPARGSAFVSSTSSSFLSSFVRASSPTKASELEKQAQLESIQNKLRKKPDRDGDADRNRQARVSDRRHRSRSRERDRDRDRDRRSRRRSRSRDRHGDRDRDRHRRRRSRSRSRSFSPRRSGNRRSVSPRDQRRSEKVRKERNDGGRSTDYSKLIDGYDRMTPAERVKAKMKLQLAETSERDEANGMGSGWERFEFDKDTPLDDEEIEVAEDDAALVKHIGQSFRFSAVEARREEQIKAAHDEAMFGSSAHAPDVTEDADLEGNNKASNENNPATNLLSDKVLARQQGSWRDRARKT